MDEVLTSLPEMLLSLETMLVKVEESGQVEPEEIKFTESCGPAEQERFFVL